MKNLHFLIAIIITITINSCSGLRVWDKGKYYKVQYNSSIELPYEPKLGIYVFSDGKPIDGRNKPFDAFNLIGDIIAFPITILSILSPTNPQIGVHQKHYTNPVTLSSSFYPDTSNSGPSLELALAAQKALDSLGYNSDIILDMGHNKKITTTECLINAQNKNYDLIFIIYYSCLSDWRLLEGYTHTGNTTIIRYSLNKGFLFIPNAALIDVKRSEIIWSYSYYGLVENAHLINLSQEPFIKIDPKALIPSAAPTYIEAAPKAVELIFNPPLWRKSFISFPSKKRKTKL